MALVKGQEQPLCRAVFAEGMQPSLPRSLLHCNACKKPLRHDNLYGLLYLARKTCLECHCGCAIGASRSLPSSVLVIPKLYMTLTRLSVL